MDMIDIILTVIRTSAIDVNNPDHKGPGYPIWPLMNHNTRIYGSVTEIQS